MSAWSLHPQLESDTVPLGDLMLSRVVIMQDANYPWLILVPRRPEVVEIFDLVDAERTQLMAEMAEVAGALKRVTSCDKINIAALGNAVPQLHVHVIARFRNDAAGMAPVWGKVAARPYEPADLARLSAALQAEIRFA